MSLTDLMSGAGLSRYAEVALVLFFGTFAALAAWVWWPSHRGWWRDAAQLPFDDDTSTATPTATPTTTGAPQ